MRAWVPIHVPVPGPVPSQAHPGWERTGSEDGHFAGRLAWSETHSCGPDMMLEVLPVGQPGGWVGDAMVLLLLSKATAIAAGVMPCHGVGG